MKHGTTTKVIVWGWIFGLFALASSAWAADYTVSVDSPSVAEGAAGSGGTLNFTVTVDTAIESGEQVTVNWATSDGTATEADGDYAAQSGSVVFDPTDTSQSFTVDVTGDSTREPDETITLTLTASCTAGGSCNVVGTNPVTTNGTIVNDDVYTISIADIGVSEADGTATFTISVDQPVLTGETVTVDFTTQEGTALNVSDFNSATGAASIGAGSSSTTVGVALVNDAVVESAEAFDLELSSPSANAILGDSAATCTITDEDHTITVTAAATQAETVTPYQFTVTVSPAITGSETVTIDFDIDDGAVPAANAGSDYTDQSGTLTFDSGSPGPQTVDVAIVDDPYWEENENFNFVLSNPSSNIQTYPASTTGVIVSDDSYTISIGDITVFESDGTATFTITLDRTVVAGETVTVGYATQQDSALETSDYVAMSGTATILAGADSTTVSVSLVDDADVEGAEVFQLLLSSPSANASIGISEANCTINNEDHTISVTSVASQNEEVTPYVFTVSVNPAMVVGEPAVTITYDIADGAAPTANAGSDYTDQTGTLTFSSATPGPLAVNVAIIDNPYWEEDENFDFMLSSASANVETYPSSTTGVITNTDHYSITIGATPATINEEDGTAAFQVLVSPIMQAGDTVTVDYTTVDGTALVGSDYALTAGTLSITSATNPGSISVPIVDDGAQEADEDFSVTLSNPSINSLLATPSATVTIEDSDYTISIANANAVEGDGSITFTVSLDRAVDPGEQVTVDFHTQDGTALAGSDYSTTTGTVTFDPGDASQPITITLLTDAIAESLEVFQVVLDNESGNAAISDAVADGNISDDDYTVASFADISVNENVGTAQLTIRLNRQVVGAPVTFDVAVQAGSTATAGADFTLPATPVTITAGNDSTTIDIPITDDTVIEYPETIIVAASPTSGNVIFTGATTPDNLATMTINIDDRYQVVAVSDESLNEADTLMTFTITLDRQVGTGGDAAPLFLRYETADGTASSPSDYDHVNGTVEIPVGATQATFTVQIHEDVIDEGASEWFLVNLGVDAPYNEIVTFSDSQGVGTILDTEYVITPYWTAGGTVTLQSPPGTPIAISNGVPVGIQNNTPALFTVTADYEITGVTFDAASAGHVTTVQLTPNVVHTYEFDSTTPQGNHWIRVNFDHQILYTATGSGTVTDPNSISVHDGGPGSYYADHASSPTFAIAADANTCVTDILLDGSHVGAFQSGTTNNWDGNSYTIANVIVDHTLEAQFGGATITVVLGADDGATGTAEDAIIQDPVHASGWRAYVANSSYAPLAFIMEGNHGDSFEVPGDIPAPYGCDARYILIEYLDADGWLKPANDQIDLMHQFKDQTVEGLYDRNSHVLEIAADHGTIILNPEGDPAVGANRYYYPADSTVSLTPVADVGWYFHTWTGDASGSADPLTVTMSSDKYIEAVFVQGCADNDLDGYKVDPGDGSCDPGPQVDCNDSDGSIHPGAVEVCGDGIDQDCTGGDLVCSGDDYDDDNDGYTENQGDCNDGDASVHPGAVDIPGNSVDEDCFDGDKAIGTEVTCVVPSDVPANAARKPAPPLIMFLIDDSGSMDWEFMINDSDQLYEGRYYVYPSHYDSRTYPDPSWESTTQTTSYQSLDTTQRREWLNQWSGYNRIFFNPEATYDPWPMWEDVVASTPAGEYDGAEQMAIRTHENSYDTDNATFPDIAFVDGFVHADMDWPRNNTIDSANGHSWSYIADDGTANRHIFELNAEFFSVRPANEGQQVIISRTSASTSGSSTAADAIGVSTDANLELATPHLWTWYDTHPYDADPANNAPAIIYDRDNDLGGVDYYGSDIYTETSNWLDSGGTHTYEWGENLRYTENVGQAAFYRLNMTSTEAAYCNAAGGCYVYAWVDEYSGRDNNASYTIYHYDASDNLVAEEVFEDQSPGVSPDFGRRWIRLGDSRYLFKEQTGVAADVVIVNAHYFVWNDADGDGEQDPIGEIYLINIPGAGHALGDYTLEYYRFDNLNGDDRIDDGELVPLTNPADYAVVKPVRYDETGVQITDDDELAYIVRQNFADWYSFYRRRILTAKAAVGLTVADMNRVELGIHTINRTARKPLALMEDADGAEKVAYLKTLYDIDASGSTYLRRALNDVGQYYLEGTTGDYSGLLTTAELPTGDTSVFWDAETDDDADSVDDSGGECQRAYVIAMTDGYYNQYFTITNQDGSSYYALTDSVPNTLADIAHKFYHTDLDTSLDDLVPSKGFDDAANQHMTTFGVSFGVFGKFDPDLFPDCLPSCDTPGENGCPNLDEIGKVTDCIVNGDGDTECQTCTRDSGGTVTCSGTRVVGPFSNMCPEWHNLNPEDSTNPVKDKPQTVDDLYHASVNGRGKFLNAADPSELVASLKAIKDLIEESQGTASSVSINTNKIEANTLVYQTSYDSGDWSGDVLAKCLDYAGNIVSCDRVTCAVTCETTYDGCLSLCTLGDTDCEEVCETARTNCYTTNNCSSYMTCSEAHTSCVTGCSGNAACISTCDATRDTCLDDPPEVKWSAEEQLGSLVWSSRRIITVNPSSVGIPFRWGDALDATNDGLTASMKVELDGNQHALNYLRGDHSCEEGMTGCAEGYRARESLLGDFINSEPYYYQNEAYDIDWVITGANDGMLHVFDGGAGTELFAFIPGTVFGNLMELTEPSYNDTHRFFVDGFNDVEKLSSSILLVGGLGKGGKGYFGIDLQAAKAALVAGTLEASAPTIVKWELNTTTPNTVAKAADATVLPSHLGYSFSRPTIIKSNDPSAERLMIFGNGYDSASGRAVLFLVGLAGDGSIVWTHHIDTGVGDNTSGTNCNGLSSPAPILPQGDGTNDYIFAGDLLGNMWKFDISDADRTNWRVYFADSLGTPKPLFTAKSNAGWRQPITMRPDVTTSCIYGTEGYLVTFGTGRLINPETDIMDLSVQTIYGVWDWSAEWAVQGGTPTTSYLGEFQPKSSAITGSCQTACSNVQALCEFDCLGNTECELECASENVSCVSNCSSVRNLSNMSSITGSTASPYIALLQQTQISVNGIIYNSDGTQKSHEYGNTNLNEVDEVVRVLSDNEMDWMLPSNLTSFVSETNKTVKHVGWYFDLPANGERAVKDVFIAAGKLVFTTAKPADDPCSGGGTSSIWVVDVCSGGRSTYAYFDLNNDGVIDENDYVNIGTPSDPIYVPPSSIDIPGISPAPTLVEVPNGLDKLFFPDGGDGGGSGGGEGGPGLTGQNTPGLSTPILYWRELDWQ